MKYEFSCEKCKIIVEKDIPIKEYSEDKFPICEKCKEKMKRNYSILGHQTFGDGYKG